MQQRLVCLCTCIPKVNQTPAHSTQQNGSSPGQEYITTRRIGILGGGQLGKMLGNAAVCKSMLETLAARRHDTVQRGAQAEMGININVLDPTPGCPASAVANHTLGSFQDFDAVTAFARNVDVLTVEIEHIDTTAMQHVADTSNVDVEPQPQTLRTIQDKYQQKVHFTSNGVPVADFREVADQAGLDAAVAAFGLPIILKSKRYVCREVGKHT